MSGDLLVGIGLVLVLEGLMWAAFPGAAVRLLQMAAETPEARLRTIGAAAVALGVLLVWIVRG